ncbi:MAG: cell division ATP-binding protein FtsE [Gammaproteobacteria bacterium]|nr:cell division ATP-binding protein FtsE [Gammaproteobacteria bacterium]
MIEFNSVTKRYSSKQVALDSINLTLPAGSMTFLTGHSGAGKSTLLRLIAALETPSAGSLRVGPFQLEAIKPRDIPHYRQQLGIVFQDNQLLNDRNVFDNVALPLIITGYRLRDIRARVGAALERVGLSHQADADIRELSGGEQQRVGIARAVVNQPRLLIADEPTGNLDASMSEDIINLFRLFNSAGVTVLLATHDQMLLQKYAYPRVVLAGGQLVRQHSAARSAATEQAAE